MTSDTTLTNAAPLPSPTAPPPASILIVDDERLNRAAVAELLQPHYRILLAKDGNTALEIIRSESMQLALVLLDVSMPGISGYDVLQEMRADRTIAHIPVIFITGQSDEAAEEYGLRLGAADYVSKPIRPAVLQARVKNQVDLFQRKRELEQLALADGLTGLANRRHFDQTLDAAYRRCLRSGEYMGLALVDIDNFKQFNDNYGHMQGDDALRSVAQLMRQHAQRAGELAARYGGEEFGFIHIGDNGVGLPLLMEELRHAVEQLALPHSSSKFGVLTISVGVIVTGPGARVTLQQMLTMADELLYSAKASGRNCVRTALME